TQETQKSFVGFDRVRKEVIKKCIFGYDINPLAVELAKFSLWIYSSQKGDLLEPLSDQFACRNTLADQDVVKAYENNGSEYDWLPTDVVKDFEGQCASFHAVVGNPPWGA